MLETKMQPVLGEDVAEIVSRLCVNSVTGVINVVGPSELTMKELLGYLPGKIRFIKIGKTIADPMMNLAMKLMPSLINPAQYEMLFKDNIADKSLCEKILGRPMQSTNAFWRTELGRN